jgi:C4-dicarboxylate-specific signal transduction histidine kinase
MLRDASDRVRAEQERQDWQTRFELAVSIARDGIVDWDLESGAATFSSRFLAILNAEKRRQNFTIAAWQQRILKPDRQRVRAAITDHLANPRVPLLIEHRINRGRGDARTVILRGMAVVDAAGRPYRLIGSLTDVTEQREAESRARQHLAELAQLARFFSVGQFVATLAHEISQPITSISAFAAGVRRQIDPAQASPLLLESLQAIQTQAERAAEIVRRVRQFVRPEGTQRQEVCLNVVAREVLALLAPELSNARVKLNVRLSKAKLIVQADPLQIEQVLVNLIRNAAEALSPLTPSRRSMGIESRSASGAAQIIIWDEGPGIDAKVQRKLFKPFVSSKEGGLGVGLALSKTLIESHGGKLSLERSPKHRTQAKILLPLLGSRSRSKSRD